MTAPDKCKNGHRFTAANTRRQKDGRGRTYRRCLTCHREGQARSRAAREGQQVKAATLSKPLTMAEVVAETAWLLSFGEYPPRVAARLGTNTRALERRLIRAGRNDLAAPFRAARHEQEAAA